MVDSDRPSRSILDSTQKKAHQGLTFWRIRTSAICRTHETLPRFLFLDGGGSYLPPSGLPRLRSIDRPRCENALLVLVDGERHDHRPIGATKADLMISLG